MTERSCRVCGCTDWDCSQCVEKTGHPCHWVEEDLCSACIRTQDQIDVARKSTRRYYLHRKIKDFTRIDVYGRTITYTDDLLEKMTAKQLRYFLELQIKFNYTAQLEIYE